MTVPGTEVERYQPILTRIWIDEKFQTFDDATKLLWFYLLTCPHSNAIGFYRLPFSYACEDLCWDMERFREPFGKLLGKPLGEPFGKPFQERYAEGLVEYDHQAKVVFIKNHLKHRPLENPNQVKLALKTLEKIPDTPILQGLYENVKRFGKPFVEPFVERLRERLAKPNNQYPITNNLKPNIVPDFPVDDLDHEHDHEPDEDHAGPDEEPDQHPEEPAAPINYDPRPSIMSMHLLNGIRTHKPDFKEPNLKTWEKDADLMIRRDGRDPDAAMKLMDWAVADSFWQGNVLSMGTFRKQYDRLEIQQRRGGNGNGKTDSKAAAREAYRGRQTTDYDANVKTLDLGE